MNLQFEKLGPGPKDRPLSKEELEFEKEAKELPVKIFARIEPLPSTIGFLFRNLEGGNYAVIGYVRELMKHKENRLSTYYAKFKKVVDFWDTLDDKSRRRIDLWDHVCMKLKIPAGKFIGLVAEGAFEYAEAELIIDKIAAKRELFANVTKFSAKERNFKDRDLLAKATKLIDDKQGASVSIDNSTVVNNSLVLESQNGKSFKDSIKRYDDIVDGEVVDEDEDLQLVENTRRQLESGEQNYIDADLLKEEKRELVRA